MFRIYVTECSQVKQLRYLMQRNAMYYFLSVRNIFAQEYKKVDLIVNLTRQF